MPAAKRPPRGGNIDKGFPSMPQPHYRLGRALQFLGLLILPFGIASELVGKVGLGQSLLIAAGGMLLFYAGCVIQNRA